MAPPSLSVNPLARPLKLGEQVGRAAARQAQRVLAPLRCSPQVSRRPVRPPRAARRPFGQAGGGADDGDSAEYEPLAAELAPLIDPDRLQRAVNHMELAWDISRQPGPLECVCCEGQGEKECGWCHGTGFMQVGDKLVRNPASAGCKECPICNGKGNCRCSACKGTGKRATWMKEPNCSIS